MSLSPERAGSEEAAKEAALRILARGPRTEREIEGRLRDRGYEEGAVERALERLRRVSLVDDRAFVRSFLRTELFKAAQGRRLLVQKMRRRGVPDALIRELDSFLEEDPDLTGRSLVSEEDRGAASMIQLRRRYGRLAPEVYRRRMQQALARRGFAWDTIRDLLGEET
ncbi:MAG TPA: regulatory protein RecX [Candidatus Polarisedimenticolia bacterium]|nr:regulatory protein RecX [Candidatus Polarisedimenticolia bacterium]